MASQSVLVAVAAKRRLNHPLHVRFHRFGATKLTNSLGCLSDRQVAGTCLAMLGLPGRSQSKSLLGRLVRLLLGHRPLESKFRGSNRSGSNIVHQCPVGTRMNFVRQPSNPAI